MLHAPRRKMCLGLPIPLHADTTSSGSEFHSLTNLFTRTFCLEGLFSCLSAVRFCYWHSCCLHISCCSCITVARLASLASLMFKSFNLIYYLIYSEIWAVYNKAKASPAPYQDSSASGSSITAFPHRTNACDYTICMYNQKCYLVSKHKKLCARNNTIKEKTYTFICLP